MILMVPYVQDEFDVEGIIGLQKLRVRVIGAYKFTDQVVALLELTHRFHLKIARKIFYV